MGFDSAAKIILQEHSGQGRYVWEPMMGAIEAGVRLRHLGLGLSVCETTGLVTSSIPVDARKANATRNMGLT